MTLNAHTAHGQLVTPSRRVSSPSPHLLRLFTEGFLPPLLRAQWPFAQLTHMAPLRHRGAAGVFPPPSANSSTSSLRHCARSCPLRRFENKQAGACDRPSAAPRHSHALYHAIRSGMNAHFVRFTRFHSLSYKSSTSGISAAYF